MSSTAVRVRMDDGNDYRCAQAGCGTHINNLCSLNETAAQKQTLFRATKDMQITEKQIPLNAQDYQKLKATKGGGLGCFLIVAVVWLIVSGFLYLLVNDLFSGSFRFDNGRIDLPSGIVVVPFSLVFLVLAFFIYRRYPARQAWISAAA